MPTLSDQEVKSLEAELPKTPIEKAYDEADEQVKKDKEKKKKKKGN
ncbi:MAG: hypothetical protein WCR02_10185 [Sphaerochaetaceae bacterium]